MNWIARTGLLLRQGPGTTTPLRTVSTAVTVPASAAPTAY